MYPELTELLDAPIGPVTNLDAQTGPVTNTAYPAGTNAGPVLDRAGMAWSRISTGMLPAEVRP
jgi:hypothetical protein